MIDATATIVTAPSQSEIGDLFRRIDKVVPVKVAERLDALYQLDERLQWQRGDLTNEIYDNVIAKKLKNKAGQPITFFDVCYYVSLKYLRGTRSMNTVKAWALTTRRFSPAVRQYLHHDEIPFSHFVYAAQHKFDAVGDSGKKVWEEVLNFSWEQSRNLGRDCSVADLEAAFEGKPRPSAKYNVGASVPDDSNQLDAPPLTIFSVPEAITEITDDTGAVDTTDLEAQEFVRVGMQVLQRYTAKHPKYHDVLMQAFSVIVNTIMRP
jgi:hypothetical protein